MTTDIRPDPKAVADAITAELGNWGIGQLGDHGLVDEIWTTCPEFQQMDADQREQFARRVYDEIYGGGPFEFPAVYRDYGRGAA